ncbi:flotillin domain-containing protein [Terasakiella sp. A23]|uniref:flotillin family protein n=1 Tax=Terasakiella sp. FCG-A23 TaxID=3080561 RepID=UPI00295442A1|nr:flotillin domain-containing protein [Terasakiella sp. A23]MDV7340475.1 flotillin domain-containing protein [Terasakiella sp. A23]
MNGIGNMFDGIVGVGATAVIIVVALLAIGMILMRLYVRASKEISFVRTGFGGQRVIMNGGALVFPVLHETIPVNMNTLRLEVRRDNNQALITRDRMRVDVVAEFYVRAQPTAESIAAAAQTLGQRTMRPDQLKELVEGKFVDSLRSVAAEMTMEELHEKRTDFVQKVQQAVTEDLLKNGLELESVSLTGLDQTSMEYFNPSNAFDAEGLTRLTEEIEQRKKIRNDIEQDTQIQIKTKNLESEKLRLDIQREEEYARLEQEREVEVRKAAQAAEISKHRAEKEQEAKQAEISSVQHVEKSKITADKAVSEERIEMEKLVREKEIEKQKSVELAEQVRAIAIAEKSKEQSEAQSEADTARAKAVQAEEKVVTARENEIAERHKAIELIEARKEAERQAISIKVAAEAEKMAAADKAEALREEAEGEAMAEKLRAEAAEIRYKVDAEGTRSINEAQNVLSAEQIAMQIKVKLIENLDQIIRESVKPMENIDGIKIVQVDGLTGGGSGGNGGAGASGGGNLADNVVNSALRYRAQAPLLDSLLKEVGINGGDINSITAALSDTLTDQQSDTPAPAIAATGDELVLTDEIKAPAE